MKPMTLDRNDLELYRRAVEVLDTAHDPVVHQVAAALRTTDGQVFVGLCRNDAGRTIVTNPCGLCRELLGHYGPDAWVLVDGGGDVVKVAAADLMPMPWMFPHENDW